MPSLTEIAYGLYGAWRLAHLDRSAMSFFDRSVGGFWKSFFAAVLVAPAYAALEALNLLHVEVTASAPFTVIVLALSYAVAWLLYPVVLHPLCRLIDREEYFIGYIVAYNWAQVLQYLAIVPVVAAIEADLLPGAFGSLLYYLVFLLILAYFLHIARAALAIGGWVALGIVVLDLVLSHVQYSIVLGMISGQPG